MAFTLSTSIKNSRLQVLCDAIDAQPTKLVIYNVGQTPVCEMDFPNPSKLSISNAVLTFQNIPESLVLLTDSVTNAEIVADDNSVLASLSVGDLASSADLKLPVTALYQGSLLRLNGWTITEL